MNYKIDERIAIPSLTARVVRVMPDIWPMGADCVRLFQPVDRCLGLLCMILTTEVTRSLVVQQDCVAVAL